MLTFEVTTADGTNRQLAGNGLFNANAQLGSMQHPYVLQLNDIIDVNTLAVKHVMLYDGSGRLVRSGDKPYTKADLKALMPGVYYQHIIYTNKKDVFHLVGATAVHECERRPHQGALCRIQ